MKRGAEVEVVGGESGRESTDLELSCGRRRDGRRQESLARKGRRDVIR